MLASHFAVIQLVLFLKLDFTFQGHLSFYPVLQTVPCIRTTISWQDFALYCDTSTGSAPELDFSCITARLSWLCQRADCVSPA